MARYDDDRSWTEDPARLPSVVARLEREHSPSSNLDRQLLRLYYQRPLLSGVVDADRPLRDQLSTFDSLRAQGFNLTREVVDAASARVCRPLTAVVDSVGGDFAVQRACEQLSAILDGVLQSVEWPEVAARCWGGGGSSTCRLGPAMFWVDTTGDAPEVRCRRLNPLLVLWPEDGCDEPTYVLVSTPVPRRRLMAEYPAMRDRIASLPAWRPVGIVGVDSTGMRTEAQTIRVVDAWSPKIGRTNGTYLRAALAGGGGAEPVILEKSRAWPYEFLPIVRSVWDHDYQSWGGVALGRILAPYHLRTNEMIAKIFASLQACVPKLLTHDASDVEGISDLEYERIIWSGVHEPKIVVPQAVSQDVVAQLQALRERAFAEAGINPQAAAGSRPTGLNSAPAQQAWIEIVDQRMLRQQQQWERLWRQAARVVVGLLADYYTEHQVRARAPGSTGLRLVDWSEVADLKKHQYEIRFELTSQLSATVSGRLEEVDRLQKLGLADVPDVARHLRIRDTEQLARRLNAPRDLAEQQVHLALSEGKVSTPGGLQSQEDLQALVRIGSQEYQRAQLNGVTPWRHLEALRRVVQLARARLETAAPAPAAEQPEYVPPEATAPALPNGAPAATALTPQA